MVNKIMGIFNDDEKNMIKHYCHIHEISVVRFITRVMENYCYSDFVEKPEVIYSKIIGIVK